MKAPPSAGMSGFSSRAAEGERLRVNVGCGSTPTAGWVNFDNSMTVRIARRRLLKAILRTLRLVSEQQLEFARVASAQGIRWADATRRIPLGDSSAEVLYSSHMLEHLDCDGALRFLQEARRVLQPGGILRIAVPDLRALVNAYLADGDADRFLRDSLLTVPARRSLGDRIRFAVLGERHHLWMYDGESLRRLLEANGFRNASIMPPAKTMIRDPGPLNLTERAEESVFVEAVRA